MKTIKVSDEMVSKITAFCNDELNYHINESGCLECYKDESEAEIFLLRQLGENSAADRYETQLKEQLDELSEDSNKYSDGELIDDEVLVEEFIEDHLKDFAGFDPYKDTNGDDYRSASNMVTEYLDSLSDEQLHQRADWIRKNKEKCYCEDAEIKLR